MRPLTWDPVELFIVVPECFSIDCVLRTLGLKITGGNRETIKRYIQDLEIDTCHFTGQGHRKGSTKPVIIKPLNEILVEHSTHKNTHQLKNRILREKLKEYQCEICLNKEWLGRPIPLEFHHKNGVRDDNRLENIEFLCPNCHALTDNYRAKKRAL